MKSEHHTDYAKLKEQPPVQNLCGRQIRYDRIYKCVKIFFIILSFAIILGVPPLFFNLGAGNFGDWVVGVILMIVGFFLIILTLRVILGMIDLFNYLFPKIDTTVTPINV